MRSERLNFNSQNILIVLIILVLSILPLFSVLPTSERIFVSWSAISANNWYRFIASVLLSAFLPGFLLFDTLNVDKKESPTRYLLFSYLLSVFVLVAVNFIVFLIIGSWVPLDVLVLTNIGLFVVWLRVKRGKIGCSGISHRFVMAILALAIFFLVVSSIHHFLIYSDQLDYHDWALNWAIAPFHTSNSAIQPSYPWWAFAYLSTMFETAGIASVNVYSPLIVLNLMPVLALFCLVRTRSNALVSSVATFLAFFTSGLGWMYLPLITAKSSVDVLQQLGWKTFDTTLPSSFLSMAPDISTGLLLMGLPSLLAVLSIALDLETTGNQKRYWLFASLLTALTFLTHVEAGIILTVVFAVLILVNQIKDARMQISFLSGLILVFLIDLVAPARYYSSINITLAGGTVPLLPLCISVISIVICSRMFLSYMPCHLSGILNKSVDSAFSYIRSCDLTLILSFGIARHLDKTSIPSNKKIFRFSLIGFLLAFLVVTFYFGSIIFYTAFVFPTYHFNVNRIPLYIYPIRLGFVGVLSVFFIIGCIFLKSHKKERLPYALILAIPFVYLLGYVGLYQEYRVSKYLPLFLAPFAAVSLLKFAELLQSRTNSKLRRKLIKGVVIGATLSLAASSMILYFQYESLCQDPTHYSSLSRRIAFSNSEISSAEFLFDNTKVSDTLATFPTGYGGAYSYMKHLTGRYTDRVFLPIFAIKQPVDFFKIASNIQLKYIYLDSVDEKLVNKYYKDGFLSFYTSLTSIAYQTNETKIYSIPNLSPPNGDAECTVLNVSPFQNSASSQNATSMSYLLMASSKIQYEYSPYSATGMLPQTSTIVLPIDPILSSLDNYLEWVREGGNLVVLASDTLGSFSTIMSLTEAGMTQSNAITNLSAPILIPSIQYKSVTSTDPTIIVDAYYVQNQESKSVFITEKHLGNGTIRYAYLSPLFSRLLSLGNGSADKLASLAPVIANFLRLKPDISNVNSTLTIPNYVLEKPIYTGNLNVTTSYLTFYAPKLTVQQPNSKDQTFYDASLEALGQTKLSVDNSTASLSCETAQNREINPTEIYNDNEFWLIYPGHGKGNVGNASVKKDTEIVKSGSNSARVIIGSGKYEAAGIYHNFGTVDWSSIKRMSIYLYGSNSGANLTIAIYTGEETVDGAISWKIIDNFKGWKKFTFDFSAPTHIGSLFDASDVRKMYLWSDAPGTWYVDRIVIDSGSQGEPQLSITFPNETEKKLTFTLSTSSDLVINGGNQTLQITGSKEVLIKANPTDIFLSSFSTAITIDGKITFAGVYGYWLEPTPTVHDIINVAGVTTFRPTFAEIITYIYAEDSFRDFVVKYNTNPVIYISDLKITGRYTHLDER